MELPSKEILRKVIEELDRLSEKIVEVNGRFLKAGQCYRYEISPPHILFNTNCPDSLKQKINSIFSKYFNDYENR